MYLDTCVIVRLISHEPDSAAYHDMLLGQPLITSELAVAEIRSALFNKERTGRISRKDRMISWGLFQEKVREQEFMLVTLNRHVVERAGALVEQCHPQVALRTLDAIHVATAELQGGQQMCSSDLRVCQASEFIGLPLAPSPKTK